MSDKSTPTSSSGAIRLSKDFAKLVNNPVGSDIRFLVGGSSIGEKQSDISTATFYGHSLILRFRSKYFATLYDNERKEKSDGIFKKTNVSPVAFHALLYYVYTGSVEVVDSSLLPELITAAEEMELDELSNICQSRLIKELKESSKNISKEEEEEEEPNTTKKFENGKLPFGLAVRTLLIPSLILAYDHTLEILYGQLLEFALRYMETITTYKNTFNTFLEKIPITIFKQILAADSLALKEYDVWQLTLSWACHKTKLMKSAVETQIRLNADLEEYEDDDIEEESTSDNNNSNKPLVSVQQLRTLKSEINPLLPTIRFTLMEPGQYSKTIETLNYFVPARRLHEIQRFFSKPDNTSQEVARAAPKDLKKAEIPGSKIANAEFGELLRKWIYESNINGRNYGWSSSEQVNFRLLYCASRDGYQASTFHNCCDNQGATLVLVRSSNGRLFGGVNFASWTSSSNYPYSDEDYPEDYFYSDRMTYPARNYSYSNGNYSHSDGNFLFALKQNQSVKFPCSNSSYAIQNNPGCGPIFGNDLTISNNSNSHQQSTSNLPQYYNGTGACNTALAGAQSFIVSDYEVFVIS